MIHYSAVFLVCALLLFSIGLAVLQTNWAKNKIKEKLVDEFRAAGLTIESIEGRLPFQINVTGLKGNEFSIPTLQMRLALLPLMRGEIAVSYLYAKKLGLQFQESSKSDTPFVFSWDSLKLPFSISIRSFNIGEVQIQKFPLFSLAGGIKIKKMLKEVSFDLKAFDQINRAKVSGYSNKVQGHLNVVANIETFGTLDAKLEGPLETWIAFMEKKQAPLPLEGHAEVQLKKLEIPGWETLNRQWDSTLTFFVFPDYAINLSNAKVSSDLITLSGSSLLNSPTSIKSIDASFKFPHLLYKNIEGSASGTVHFDLSSYKLELLTDDLQVGHQNYKGEAKLFGVYENHLWKGSLELQAQNPLLPITASSRFIFNPGTSFSLSELSLSSQDSRLDATLEYLFSPSSLKGDVFAQIHKIEHLQDLIPQIPIKGQLGAEFHFSKDQTATIHASLKNGQLMNHKAKDLTLHANLTDIFTSPRGEINLEGENVLFSKLELSSLRFDTSWSDYKWPYKLCLKGEGFELTSNGIYEENRLEIQEFSGFALKKPFAIENPLELIWKKDQYSLNDLNLKIDGGDLHLDFSITPKNVAISLKGTDIPLDLLTIYYPSVALKGITSFQGELQDMQGRFNLLFSGADAQLLAKGSLQATFDQNILQLRGRIEEAKGQELHLSATLPIHYQLYPFQFVIDKNRDLAGEFEMDGNLEDIFDFVDLGAQHISGWLSTHLYLAKTLSSPSIRGSMELKNGSYENYFTGTLVKEVNAFARAENHQVTLERVTAKDSKDGALTGTGYLTLKEKFPFLVQAQLEKVNAVNFEMIGGTVSGPMEISGSTDETKLKADVVVDKAEGEIPDSLPAGIPTLSVTYLHKPAEESSETPVKSASTFHLDIHFNAPPSAPGKVLVRGRGLRSEWGGDIHLIGPTSDLKATGSLSLLRGDFSFAGQIFKLEEGEIILGNKLAEEAYIKIKATLPLAEYTITAMLTGPVTSPVLTFQSTPYLPTSSILSYILFNKDIPEISTVQAVQLAQMIVTLSGKMGPDVLETIRKGLGVDRLNIISCEDGVAIQIGKYLTRGVMVTLAQGTDSSQVVVEVELKHGFIFQAETQPGQEGKFSLKWHKNY